MIIEELNQELREAVKKLDEVGTKILLVVEDNKVLDQGSAAAHFAPFGFRCPPR